VHAVEDVTDENSAFSDKSSRSLGVLHAIQYPYQRFMTIARQRRGLRKTAVENCRQNHTDIYRQQDTKLENKGCLKLPANTHESYLTSTRCMCRQ